MTSRKCCLHCVGVGKKKEPCDKCDGKGYIMLAQSYHACHDCANLRCHKCGGDGCVI